MVENINKNMYIYRLQNVNQWYTHLIVGKHDAGLIITMYNLPHNKLYLLDMEDEQNEIVRRHLYYQAVHVYIVVT